MDDILRSHLIEPVAVRTNDFDAFFEARECALLDRIERATGKPIARDASEPEVPAPMDYQDEEDVA